MFILVQEYVEADRNGFSFSVKPLDSSSKYKIIEFEYGKSGTAVNSEENPTTVSENGII